MEVKWSRKSGHNFFEFNNDGVVRSVCVDGWINSVICPDFCNAALRDGWEPCPDSKVLRVNEVSGYYEIVLPTCFGFISRRGVYRKAGAFHMSMSLEKSGLSQYLYNYTIL